MVELFGRIGLNVYNNTEGITLGSLTFHTSNIKILVFPKTENTSSFPQSKRKKRLKISQTTCNADWNQHRFTLKFMRHESIR